MQFTKDFCCLLLSKLIQPEKGTPRRLQTKPWNNSGGTSLGDLLKFKGKALLSDDNNCSALLESLYFRGPRSGAFLCVVESWPFLQCLRVIVSSVNGEGWHEFERKEKWNLNLTSAGPRARLSRVRGVENVFYSREVKILLFYDLGAVDGATEFCRTFPISFLHSLLGRGHISRLEAPSIKMKI